MAIAPIRTPIVDDDGKLTAEWQRFFAVNPAQEAGTGGPPDPLDAPSIPTSPALTVTEYGDNYRITPTWTPPSPLGTTAAYQVQFKFYTDAACTTPEGDWSGTNITFGGAATSLTTDLWPKADAIRYVRCRVRGLNADYAYTAWVESASGSGETITAASTAVGPSAPTQPVLADWTLGTVTYLADLANIQFASLNLSLVNPPPGDAQIIQFWLYKGAAPPSDHGLWQSIGDLTEVGSFTNWQQQPSAAETWCVCATGSRYDWEQRPLDATPYVTVNIAAWAAALTLTISATPISYSGPYGTMIESSSEDLDVTAYEVGGMIRGRYKCSPTLPADDNRQAYRLYRRWTAASYAAPKSDWFLAFGPTTSPWEQVESDWVFPADEWSEWQFRTLGHDNTETVCSPIVQMHLSGGGVQSASALDTTSIGGGLTIDGSQLVSTSEGFLDGDFAFGLKEWNHLSGVAASTDGFSGNDSALLTANSVDVYLWQFRPCTAGQLVRLQAASKTTGITGAAPIARIMFFNAAGSLIGGEGVGQFTQTLAAGTNAWSVNVLVWGEAPANTATVYVMPLWLPSSTGGTANVDMVSVGIFEPGSVEVTRDATGRLSFAAGALGSMSKYPSYCRPVLNGTTDPGSDAYALASATNGSYYVNTTSRKIFKRVGGTWTNVEAADVVAGGTFIGNALQLTANGITANVLSASDGSSGVLSGYYGLSVEYTGSGTYKSVVGPDTIWIYNKDFATVPALNMGFNYSGIALAYGKSGNNQALATFTGFGTQSGNVTTYAYGQVRVINYGTGHGNQAGYFVDGLRVVRERQSLTITSGAMTPTDYPGASYLTNFTNVDAFFGATTGWCYRVVGSINTLNTDIANIKAALAAHGLTT